MRREKSKTNTITVRCSEKEKLEIDEKAKKYNMTRSKYLKELGLKSQGNIRKSTLQKKIAEELCEFQTAINNMAKNITKEESEILMRGINRLWEKL